MQIYEFAILLLSFYQHGKQLALAVVGDETAEEYVWNCHTQGDADDDERSLDEVVHTYGYFAYHAVHVIIMRSPVQSRVPLLSRKACKLGN